MDQYDIALWRPCTYEQYVSELTLLIYTPNAPLDLTTTVEQLPDGRYRYVTSAHVYSDTPVCSSASEPTTHYAPYLMVIAHALTDHETAKPRCFVSTAELAVG